MYKLLLPAIGFFSDTHRKKTLLLYIALLFLSCHWALVLYINSSFLGQFMVASQISMLYIAGAVLLLFSFFHSPTILRSVGNYRFTISLTILEICALVGMAIANSATIATLYFLLHFISVPLLLFNLDVFIEDALGSNERKTGSLHGLYLSLISFAAAASQLGTGVFSLQNNESFTLTYFVSSLLLTIFGLIIVVGFRKFQDPLYTTISYERIFSLWRTHADIRNIVIISFFLQLFFTFMVIYTPLYLTLVVGFSWKEVGVILFTGLSAYALFEWPIGIIADKYIGEKEMMALGFVVIAVSTSWFAFLGTAPIVVWMVAMFATRVGASLVEATCESYFFKHVASIDTHVISLFRMTSPLAAIVAAVCGSIALLYIPFNLLFIVIAFLMIPGLFFTLLLKDTR